MFSRSAFASRVQIKSYFEKHKWSLQFDGTTKNGWKKKWRESDKMLFYWHRNKFSCLLSAWRSLCDNQINLDVLIKLLTCTKNIIFIRKFLGRSYFRSQFNLGGRVFFVFRFWCRCTSTVSSVKCIAWICACLPLYRFCSIWWSCGHDQPTESHKRNLMQMQKHKMPI